SRSSINIPGTTYSTIIPSATTTTSTPSSAAFTRRVKRLKYDKVAQALEITKLKRRVKKLEKGNRGRQAEIYKIDMDHASKALSMQEDKLAEVHEVVDVVTTAKLITEVVTGASESVTTASTTISAAEPQVPTVAITTAAPLHEELNKDIDWDVAIEHVKQKAKEDPAIEDLELLWSLVKERFSTSKLNNFSDDFLLTTLGAMFERPNGKARVWKNQRTVHGQAKLILLVERRYPLLRFTLDQMLNAVRLRVEEHSEMSLELLRFTRQQHQEGQLE
nr:hypothetical protein [Tanacetum cinerariifolium]